MHIYALMFLVLWFSYSHWNDKNEQLDGFCGKYFEVRTRLFHPEKGGDTYFGVY